MDRWTPSGAGADFKLSPILASLEPYKKYVTSFGNLENKAMIGGVHSLAPATWLSGVKPERAARGASMETTLDQIVARQIGQDTTLAVARSRRRDHAAERRVQRLGVLLQHHAVVPRRALAAADGVQPAQGLHAAVRRGRHAGGARRHRQPDVEPARSRHASRTSALQRDLGAADRARLGDYLDTVREIERRVQLASSRDLSTITVPEAPIGELNAFDEQVDLLFDLIALAYQADLTRVASYIMVAEGTNRTYNHIGVSDAFHPVSHHANDLGRLEKLAKIQTWHVERFAAFLKKLADVPDGDGTLLDHSMFLYGSNMSNSDRHNGHPLPTILVGGGNGTHKGGQHLELREPTPLANLHLTILDKVGAGRKAFGDSTGRSPAS